MVNHSGTSEDISQVDQVEIDLCAYLLKYQPVHYGIYTFKYFQVGLQKLKMLIQVLHDPSGTQMVWLPDYTNWVTQWTIGLRVRGGLRKNISISNRCELVLSPSWLKIKDNEKEEWFTSYSRTPHPMDYLSICTVTPNNIVK